MKKIYIILETYYNCCNGTLLDCLDLFLWCKKNNIDIGLCLINNKLDNNCSYGISYIHKLYDDRYSSYLSSDVWKKCLDNIIIIKKIEIPRYVSNAIIFDFRTLTSCYDFLKYIKNVAFVSNIVKGQKEESFIYKENITTFYEEQYNLVGKIPYRQKYLLHHLKSSTKFCTDRLPLIIHRNISNREFIDLLYKNIWIEPFNILDNTLEKIDSTYNKNFLGRISEIFYFQSPKFYDRKPRILLEAKLLNIPIHFYHLKESIIDGAIIRYNNLKNDIMDREYSFNDELILWICKKIKE